MDIEITDERIEVLFLGTNFGPQGHSKEGRKSLMVECVLKIASGYKDGSTITTICKEAGLILKSGRVSQRAIRWAFMSIYKNGKISPLF